MVYIYIYLFMQCLISKKKIFEGEEGRQPMHVSLFLSLVIFV